MRRSALLLLLFSCLGLAQVEPEEGVVSSLNDYRALLNRLNPGTTLYAVVPEITSWTQRLVQEARSRRWVQVIYYLPQGTARTLCGGTSSYIYGTVRVLPTEELPPEKSLFAFVPPRNSGGKLPGLLLMGRGLVEDPSWQDRPDWVSTWTRLVPQAPDLPEAWAWVWGRISERNLQARVWFLDYVLGRYRGFNFTFDASWHYSFTLDAGRGPERFIVKVKPPVSYGYYPVEDAEGRGRGWARVRPFWGGYWVYGSVQGWTRTWRSAQDNDRPVEAGGYVTAEGKRYRVSGFETYLLPGEEGVKYYAGNPYFSFILKSLGLDLQGLPRDVPARATYPSLYQFCRRDGQ